MKNILSILFILFLWGCGEEQEMAISKESLKVNEPEIPDSVCTRYETVTDYKEHYQDLLDGLPASAKTRSDVRKAFRLHIEDSSLSEIQNGVIIYYLNRGYGLRLHNKSATELDSVTLIRAYNDQRIIKNPK